MDLPFTILSIKKSSVPMLNKQQVLNLQKLYLRHGDYIPLDIYNQSLYSKDTLQSDEDMHIDSASYRIARQLVYWNKLRNHEV